MTRKFDLNRTVTTRRGNKVKILYTTLPGPCPIVAANFDLNSQRWIPQTYYKNGRALQDVKSSIDLVNPDRTLEKFWHVYSDEEDKIHWMEHKLTGEDHNFHRFSYLGGYVLKVKESALAAW